MTTFSDMREVGLRYSKGQPKKFRAIADTQAGVKFIDALYRAFGHGKVRAEIDGEAWDYIAFPDNQCVGDFCAMYWRELLAKLTPEQKDMMLAAMLEVEMDLGADGTVRFRESEDGEPADFFWNSSGDSLIGLT